MLQVRCKRDYVIGKNRSLSPVKLLVLNWTIGQVRSRRDHIEGSTFKDLKGTVSYVRSKEMTWKMQKGKRPFQGLPMGQVALKFCLPWASPRLLF